MSDDAPSSSSSAGGSKAGEAFLVNPRGGVRGPAILVLHSWWGLDEWTKDFCTRVADLGYSVVAPDLLDGELPQSIAEGEAALAAQSPDALSGLVISSAHTARAIAVDQASPIAVIGFSMGGSMALWLSARLPHSVAAVVTFYGAQAIDFDEAQASFQGHFGDADTVVSEEDRVTTEAFIGLGDNPVDFHTYEGAGHWFAEQAAGEMTGTFDQAAAELAWERMVPFLAEALPPSPPAPEPAPRGEPTSDMPNAD